MGINYAAMVKRSAQQSESDSHKFPEGDTLLMLVAVDRCFPDGQGSLSFNVYGGFESEPNKAFKRSVLTYDQPLCKHPDYVEAYGDPVPEVCPIAGYIKTLDHEAQSKSKPSEITLWVGVPLAVRPKGAKANTPWTQNYVKPQWFTAKIGGKVPHIQGQLNELFPNVGAEGLERIFSRHTAQLLIVTRKGLAFDTSFTVKLADGEDASFGDLANWAVPDEINADIDEAIKPGGACDLITVAASTFSPRMAEIEQKLFGNGAETSE